MIETVHLFQPLDDQLILLLRSLSKEDWNKPTIAKLWVVKDIASHLLDGNMRTLSLSRDKHSLSPDRTIDSYETLVAYLNQLNADWVTATKRLSPEVLVELLERSGKQYSAYIATLDPEEDALFSVAWAGEDRSKNWFHIAREYTEKWHHQQQIRDAVGKPGILTQELYYPVIDTFMRGLPHTFRNTDAEEGTVVRIAVDGAVKGEWFLLRHNNKWQQGNNPGRLANAGISVPAEISWKVFTKGMTAEAALSSCRIDGNGGLASVVLKLIAVMA